MEIISENINKVTNIVLEAINNSLPNSFKEYYQSQENRKQVLLKYGKKAFLLPEKLKFPIVDPNTGKPDCRLIYAAYIRAKQWESKPGYDQVANKAKNMYDEMKCTNTIKINIQDSDLSIDLDTFVQIFDSE